ncbi:hypothetical protein [Diaphorobacter sp. J5-51]|nr:hypothetical protein [Diaphorobacter sp. J5-51]
MWTVRCSRRQISRSFDTVTPVIKDDTARFARLVKEAKVSLD